MTKTIEERADWVPRADYERAFTLVEGPERGRAMVNEMWSNLEKDPDAHVVNEPTFIALLAFFSDAGRALARALLTPDEVRRLQRDLWAAYPSIRSAYPTFGSAE
jgi:hypothetical protein